MRIVRNSALVTLLAIIPAFALDEKKAFRANRAETYPAKSVQGKVTVAVVPFDRPEDMKQAFGKADLDKHNILPVLVVIDNDGPKAIKVDLQSEYVSAGGRHLESIPADEIMYLNGPRRPKGLDQPRFPIPTRKPKNKLEAWEVTGRAFTAKMVPPGESVSGFVYFQTARESGAKIYLTGLSESNTGKELFYFEIPLPSDQ
jgi:hypothetical protein